MTITDVGNLFMFAGGLGMFLYGMHSMSGGIQKTAGNKMKELLGILTSNHFMAVVVGALVTAIIQSSGATTVMVVGFVNAGIMTLTQAVATSPLNCFSVETILAAFCNRVTALS